jgi:hypothetical protein
MQADRGNHGRWRCGFCRHSDYQAVAVRDGLIFLSWPEHNGSTIVHALDVVSGEAYTAATPFKGEFMRLRGRIHIIQAGIA